MLKMFCFLLGAWSLGTCFPGGTSGKEPACQCRRHKSLGWIPGSGRAPGEGHGRLQFTESQRVRHDWRDLAHTHGSRQRVPEWLVLSKHTLNARIPVCSFAWLCLTLCDPMDCSPTGSSVHGIFQARTLEWVAISFSRACCCPVTKSCLTLCDPLDCSTLPVLQCPQTSTPSSSPGVLSLEWVSLVDSIPHVSSHWLLEKLSLSCVTLPGEDAENLLLVFTKLLPTCLFLLLIFLCILSL